MELNVPQSRPHNYFMHPSTHKLPHIPVLAWQRLRGCHVRRCHTFYFFPLGRYSGNLIAGGESADGPVRGEGGRKGHDALGGGSDEGEGRSVPSIPPVSLDVRRQ